MFRFAEFEIDEANRTLTARGTSIALEPKVFDLIAHLAGNPNRLITRDELIETVWSGRIVSDATVASCIKAARKALGDDGKQQTYIKTVHGAGIRFAGVVSNGKMQAGAPKLIILPLEVIGEEIHRMAADKLVIALSTILTRVPFVEIASRKTSFAYRDKQVTPSELREETGANYYVEGSITSLGSGATINLELADTERGSQRWAQDFSFDDVNDHEKILLAVLPRLEAAFVETLTSDLNAVGEHGRNTAMLIEALGTLSIRGWKPDSFEHVIKLLDSVIEAEPKHPIALAYRALVLGLAQRVGMLVKGNEADEAKASGEAAIKLAPSNSIVLGLVGCAFSNSKDFARGIPMLRKAIDINPNNAQAWASLGSALHMNGNIEEAIPCLQRGIDQSPYDAVRAVWGTALSIAHMQKGDLAAARKAADAAHQADLNNQIPLLARLVIELNSDEECNGDTARLIRQLHPDISEAEVTHLLGRKMGNLVWESLKVA